MILRGHVLDRLRELPDNSVQACITSPPYWALRNYGTEPQIWGGKKRCDHAWQTERYYTESGASAETSEAFSEAGSANAERLKKARWRKDALCTKCGAWWGELGLEPTPQLYLKHIAAVFAAVWRVLMPDGVLILNMGSKYIGSGCGHGSDKNTHTLREPHRRRQRFDGYKEKDVFLAAEVAIALRNAGWHLRSEIVWHKLACMPESAKDRPTLAHEMIYMLTKSQRYFVDMDAVSEPCTSGSHARGPGVAGWAHEGDHDPVTHNQGALEGRATHQKAKVRKKLELISLSFAPIGGESVEVPQNYKGSVPGRKDGPGQDRRSKKPRSAGVNPKAEASEPGTKQNASFAAATVCPVDRRNCRTVKTFKAEPSSEDHYASYPTSLARWAILMTTRPGDTVLDPFAGTGTTLLAAVELGRNAIGIELLPKYCAIAERRLSGANRPLPLEGE